VLKLVLDGKSSGQAARGGDAEVVLRDNEDLVFGLAWTAEGKHWIEITGVATFRLAPGSDEVVAFPEPGASLGGVEQVFYSSVLPIALHALHGYQSLHASAVLFEPFGVVAFAAVSETGKSTIAAGLSARGHPLWADDALAFDARPDARFVECIALPFALRLKPDPSRARTSDPSTKRSVHRTARLAAVCLPERRAGDRDERAAEVVRLSPTDAVTAVLPHAYFFSLGELERRRQTIEDYLELVARVPVLQVRFDATLERLPGVLDEIERGVRDALS
jgi:hypothetical protein